MCCESNPNVSPEVNRARCASVAGLVIGCTTIVVGLIAFVAGGWLLVLGGVLTVVGASMLVCCGPTQKAQGKCAPVGALVLYILSAVLMLCGFAVLLAAYSAAAASSGRASCGEGTARLATQAHEGQQAHAMCDAAVSVGLGILSVVVWPALVLTGLAGALNVWGAVACCKAVGALDRETANLNAAVANAIPYALPASGTAHANPVVVVAATPL